MNDVRADIDVRFYVGHMEPPECEHHQHGTEGTHHAGIAAWYARFHCVCGDKSELIALCQPFVDYCKSLGRVRCEACHQVYPGADILILVTKVS